MINAIETGGDGSAVRALIIYSSTPKITQLAQAVAEGLRAASVDVQLMEARTGSDTIVTAPYDLICVGSPVLGLFGGRFAEDVDSSVRRCSRLEGKQAAVFVSGGLFGVGKAQRRLMALLERQGAWVQDFASLSSKSDAAAFGRRLEGVLKKRY